MQQEQESSDAKKIYIRCTHCGDEIFWNTHKSLTYCQCEQISVDGCEYYVRINGNKGDYEHVQR